MYEMQLFMQIGFIVMLDINFLSTTSEQKQSRWLYTLLLLSHFSEPPDGTSNSCCSSSAREKEDGIA